MESEAKTRTPRYSHDFGSYERLWMRQGVRANFTLFQRTPQENLGHRFWPADLDLTEPHDGPHRSPCTTSPGLKGRQCSRMSVQPWIAHRAPSRLDCTRIYLSPRFCDHEVLLWVGCCSVPPLSCQRWDPAQHQCQCCIICCS